MAKIAAKVAVIAGAASEIRKGGQWSARCNEEP